MCRGVGKQERACGSCAFFSLFCSRLFVRLGKSNRLLEEFLFPA